MPVVFASSSKQGSRPTTGGASRSASKQSVGSGELEVKRYDSIRPKKVDSDLDILLADKSNAQTIHESEFIKQKHRA